MQAYKLELDHAKITEARPDQVPDFRRDYASWLREADQNEHVPHELTKYWPKRAVAMGCTSTPSAWLTAHTISVSESVKDLIEDCAPGVHQFLPFTLEVPAVGSRSYYQYFSLRVADHSDDVHISSWTMERVSALDDIEYWTRRISDPFALPAESIRGKHLWRNRKLKLLFISGRLRDALVQTGLTSGITLQEQIVI
jgi:hypothetical protein